MAPSPISSHFESEFEIDVHSDMLLKTRWEARGRDFDSKAVGSHLPLNKRNSMPMPCNTAVNCGTNAAAVVEHSLKSVLANHHQQLALKNSAAAQLISFAATNETLQSVHRKLDRSYSEPVRPQTQPSQVTTGASRYKTELCRPFAETGKCKYSDKCQFAHGYEELRSMTRHPKYKTELCRTFHSTGLCGYGTRCHFIHNEDERRSPTGSPSPPALGSPTGSINCRPLGGGGGPLPYPPTAEEYGGGSPPGYSVGQSPYSNESVSPLSYRQNAYSEQSPKHYGSGPTSPTYSSTDRSSNDSYDQSSPPHLSPTMERGLFEAFYGHGDINRSVSSLSPPLGLNELSSALFSNVGLGSFHENTEPLDHQFRVTLSSINLADSHKYVTSKNCGIVDDPIADFRLPIFESIVKNVAKAT